MDELQEEQDKERERFTQTISDIESQLQKANVKVKLLTNKCVVVQLLVWDFFSVLDILLPLCVS